MYSSYLYYSNYKIPKTLSLCNSNQNSQQIRKKSTFFHQTLKTQFMPFSFFDKFSPHLKVMSLTKKTFRKFERSFVFFIKILLFI